MTETMAKAFLLGWTAEATYQGYLTHSTLRREYQLQLSYEQKHRRGHAFMLRLFGESRSEKPHAWPPFAYDEPIYEGIIERWRVPDPQILTPWLLAACDRHTHEVRPDTDEIFHDFASLLCEPLEFLLLFRLRELAGLRNSVLKHPLMDSPFDRPPELQPSYVADDLMRASQTRVHEDWPQFEEIVSLESLRRSLLRSI